MADTRKIVIEIQSGSSSSDGKSNEERESSLTSKLLHPIKSIEKATVGKHVLLNQAYQNTKSLVIQTASTSINRYFSLSEDYIMQNTVSNTMTTLNKVKGLGQSVLLGAQMGGPVGALFGLGAWGVSEFINNQANLSSYYEGINAANYQTQYTRTRAGLVDNGRGTEN